MMFLCPINFCITSSGVPFLYKSVQNFLLRQCEVVFILIPNFFLYFWKSQVIAETLSGLSFFELLENVVQIVSEAEPQNSPRISFFFSL